MFIRNTKQKQIILSIIENSYEHPNAEEIYIEARKELPNISLGTVYRNLNNLTNNHEIKRINSINGIDRYDRIEDKHNHFICTTCNKIIDVEDDVKIDKKVLKNNKVIDYDIYFKGICGECLEKEN